MIKNIVVATEFLDPKKALENIDTFIQYETESLSDKTVLCNYVTVKDLRDSVVSLFAYISAAQDKGVEFPDKFEFLRKEYF